ncbi:MAG: type II toxin-antitoxin system prevent-host-death family antitoxin [Holophagales bacterium]|nr:type II toxin-antitoxin system prevent-host-death family antitoxin [Holophagales bacterium]MYF94447.1 type II toxin-antitoxin system prevent-host-death family antitoxin [Holophagales bacterium]
MPPVPKITQRQLRNDSAKVLRAVQEGQSMTITRNGTPVAELRPLAARRFVSRVVLEEAAKTAPRIDARRFRNDVDAIVDPRVHE